MGEKYTEEELMDNEKDTQNNADELSEYYERQSRRYSKTLDCESEVE